MNYLPEDDAQRKGLPIFRLLTHYFPRAIREVTKVSVANNVRYNPERDPTNINWARGKSTDQLGSLFRHLMEHEVDPKLFEFLPAATAQIVGFDRVYVLAEAAWRALAALELEVEATEAAPFQQVARAPDVGPCPGLVNAFRELPPVLGSLLGSPGVPLSRQPAREGDQSSSDPI